MLSFYIEDNNWICRGGLLVDEKRYIQYRKIKAFGNKLCFYICRVFPIKRNLISVCTFEGKGGFGCNPKYIVQELHRKNPDYKFVWLVDNIRKEFPDYIKKVPNTLWSRAYWLSVSKVWIDNYRKPYGTCKRRHQYYINTWHGTIGFKTTGLWRGKAFSPMAYLVSKNDSDMIDAITVDSEWCLEMFPRGLLYEGNFWKIGAPRCDVLYGDKTAFRYEIRKKHGLNADVKIAMYAPTFREKNVNGVRGVYSEKGSLDFERLLFNLEKRFGGTWYLCLRLHPQLSESVEEYTKSILENRTFNETKADDMYDILAGMDVLITDYSCVAMDAGFGKIPVFIYADDVEDYIRDRGSLLWNMSSDSRKTVTNNKRIIPGIDAVLPFPIAQSNEELEENILNFDVMDYRKKVEKFAEDVELIFDGRASSRAADKIDKLMHK